MARRQSAAMLQQMAPVADALRRAIAVSKAWSTYTPEMATTICAMIGAGIALCQVADQRGMHALRGKVGAPGSVVITPSASRPRARYGAEPRPRRYHCHNFLVTVA